jgi:ABC-2 type transport system ATP-binding protein
MAAVLGMESALFQPVQRLSGGMRRKLEIIRSLMHRPRVLFLDEPTTGLDAESRRSLWAYLAAIRQRQETTIVLTTHYLAEAEAADRILILNHGQIVAQGAPADITAELGGASVEIDAADRVALRHELIRLGARIEQSADGPLRVSLAGRSAAELVQALATPLTVLRTRQASLEDVYLRILADDGA